MKKAMSPLVSAAPAAVWESAIDGTLASMELSFMKPAFIEVDPGTRVLPVSVESLPNLTEVSYTHPDVVSVWFESFVEAEPQLEFASFCKGFACAALVVPADVRPQLPSVLEIASEHASAKGTLPALSFDLEAPLAIVLQNVLDNGEPSSWRPLIAFSVGALWLLSFISAVDKVEVTVAGAKEKVTVLNYVLGFLLNQARLGYLPQ